MRSSRHGGLKLADWKGLFACGTKPALSERALADGVSGIYEAMYERDELVMIGHRITPVGKFLREAINRYGRPQAIAADRYRAGELEDGVMEEGLSLPEPTWRGQGYKRWCDRTSVLSVLRFLRAR